LGGPKALLCWSGRSGGELPLAMAHAEALLGAESQRVLVVTREAMAAALRPWLRPGVELVCSSAAEPLGAAGSLGAAAHRLGPEPKAASLVVTPVDCPPARAATVAQLLERLAGQPDVLAVRPRHDGRRGHPVVLRPALLDRYRQPEPPPLRDLLRSLGPSAADEPVDDRAVLVDFDTPADLAAWAGKPRFVAVQ